MISCHNGVFTKVFIGFRPKTFKEKVSLKVLEVLVGDPVQEPVESVVDRTSVRGLGLGGNDKRSEAETEREGLPSDHYSCVTLYHEFEV